MFPNIERFGMLMLTVGPILNLSAYVIFRNSTHPSWLYNRNWLSSETLELSGISILDVSMMDMEEHLVLFAEVVGFIVLCAAAGLQIDYDISDTLPTVGFRLDMIHSGECFGLIMLIIVAYGQFRIKLNKHEQEQQNHSHHHHHPHIQHV
jgi:hypothetical protein